MSRKGSLSSFRHHSIRNKTMGIFTSGGDAPGMNAAVRASIRLALFLGIKVYIIKEGYKGMIEGGNNIIEADWISVFKIIHLGGTVIGTSRSAEFYTREGRLKAALNLVERNITNLIIIGGDGSLAAGNLFREEWKSLLDELFQTDKISQQDKDTNDTLFIIGLVSSIDNDFCGTEMTIGTDSSLHRIMEAFDSIQSTAYSHQRAFILEIMGRHCGYLALCTALAIGADFLFIPESPVSVNWKDELCDKLLETRKGGKRLNVIIAAEGAIDRSGEAITSAQIKQVLTSKLNLEIRITVLGHVQRGGKPSAFDRILAARMSVEAVVALSEATHNSESMIIAIDRNKIRRLSLIECVERTKMVGEAIAAKDFETATELRGIYYKKNIELYRKLALLDLGTTKTIHNTISGENSRFRLAVMHIGAPCSGMNAAVRAFVRICLYRGHSALGIHDGIKGLISGDIKEMGWYTVSGWVDKSGAFLGSNNLLPDNKFKQIAERFKEFNIHGLLLIGGFEAYICCCKFLEERVNYPEFCIPLLVIPATIHNNVPGTEISLGCDTALNIITEVCDNLYQNVQGTKRDVYIVETMGDHCGFLPTLAGIAAGVDTAYIFEEKFSINDLQIDLERVIKKVNAGIPIIIILRGENANNNYTTDFLHRLYSEEGKNIFTCNTNVIGPMQNSGSTTAFDRNFGTKLAAHSADWFVDHLNNYANGNIAVRCFDNETACVLGYFSDQKYKVTPISQLISQTDFDNRLPLEQWWIKLRPLLKILSLHNTAYNTESEKYTNKEFKF